MRSKAAVDVLRFFLHVVFSAAVLAVFSNPAVAGGGLPSREEVLGTVYGKATPRAERLFLTDAQRAEAERQAGAKIASLLVGRYTLVQNGREVGRAYVDTHVVRSKKKAC